MESKKSKGSIFTIVILVILVIALGGYIVYDKCIAKDNNTNTGEKCKTEEKNQEEKEIEYVFDKNNIYNKRDNKEYEVVDKDFSYATSEGTTSITEKENGYTVNDSYYNITYDISKKYKDYIQGPVFYGAPDISSPLFVFLNEDGTIEYLKFSLVSSDANHQNEKYEFKMYKIYNLKDVVKLYRVKTTIDSMVSPHGLTVVAQTKDGQLYDLIDYLEMH